MAQRVDELPLHALQQILTLAVESFCVDAEARATSVCSSKLQQLAGVSRPWSVAMRGVLHAHTATTHEFKLERFVTEYITHYPSGCSGERAGIAAAGYKAAASGSARKLVEAREPESAPSSQLAKTVASIFSAIVGKLHGQHAFPWEEIDTECAAAPARDDTDVPERLLSAPEELDHALEAFLLNELQRLKTSLLSSASVNPVKLRELRLSESDFGFSINGRHEDSLRDWAELQIQWHSIFSLCRNLQRLDLSNISLLSLHIPAILIAASTHCIELKVLVLPQQECLGYKRRNVKPVFDALYAALENWHSASLPTAVSSSTTSTQLIQHRQRGLRRLVMPKLFAYEFYDEHMTMIARFCPLLKHVEGLRLAPIFQARGLSHHQVMSSWIHAWGSFCDSCLHLREWNWFEIPFVDEFFAIFAAQKKLRINSLTLPGNTTLWKRDYVYQEHQEPNNCVCTPQGMKTILQACPNLTTLAVLFSDRHLMFGNENPFLIGDDFLSEVVSACPRIEVLRLTEAQTRHGFEKTNTISDAGISGLAKLQYLRSVELSGVDFSAQALFTLATESHANDSEMPRRRISAIVGVRGIRKIDIAANYNTILSELLVLLLERASTMSSCETPQFVVELQIDTANHQLPVHWAAPFRRHWFQLKQQLMRETNIHLAYDFCVVEYRTGYNNTVNYPRGDKRFAKVRLASQNQYKRKPQKVAPSFEGISMLPFPLFSSLAFRFATPKDTSSRSIYRSLHYQSPPFMFGTLSAPVAELSWQLEDLASSASLIPIATAFIVAMVLIYKTRGSQPHKAIAHSPDSLPILYNMLSLIKHRDDLLDWVALQNELLGGRTWLLQMVLGDSPTVVINTPELIEDVLVMHFENFGKGEYVSENFRDLLGDGIFAVDGLKWVHQRKTASNLFSHRDLKETMDQTVSHQVQVLTRILEHHATDGTPVDMFRLMNRFTLDVFAEIGFGVKMGTLEGEDTIGSQCSEGMSFESAFDEAQKLVVMRFIKPCWLWKTQRYLNIGSEMQLKACIKVIDDTVLGIIEQSLKNRQNMLTSQSIKGSSSDPGRPSGRKDIVSLFLDHVSNDTKPHGDTEFDPKFLRDVVVNFLIAGRDTTAQALSWFFYCLSQNPHAEQKIREELAAKLPGLANASSSMEQLHQFVYLEAAIKETLRLYPSVPDSTQQCLKDTLLCDGSFVKAGMCIAYPGYSLGRMTHVWGPDAKEFKPERWIDSSTDKLIAVSAFKFNAFHAGPRMCLGMNMALMEMKTVAAVLLRQFCFSLVPGHEVTYVLSLTLPMKNGLSMHVSHSTPSAH